MIDLQIEPTKVTPLVRIDIDAGKIELRGKSAPEQAIAFYFPIIERLKKTFSTFSGTLTVDLGFEYFNTSSSKCLFDLLRMLKRLEGKSLSVKVNWFYEEEDDDMLETGEDFEDVLGMQFIYHAVEDVEATSYHQVA